MAFSRKKTVPSGYKKVAAYPDFSRSMKKFFSAGQPIETFPADGFVSTAESRKLEKVYSKFLEEVKSEGKKEIDKAIFFDPLKKEYFLKNIQADYYIIGYLGKAFRGIERSLFWSHISGFSTLASIISLGTFPVIDARNRNTKYAVYDREMNLIDEINNNDSFIIIRAWRLSPNCPGCDRETSEIVYENDIRETQKQVLEIINGIRSKSSQ